MTAAGEIPNNNNGIARIRAAPFISPSRRCCAVRLRPPCREHTETRRTALECDQRSHCWSPVRFGAKRLSEAPDVCGG